MDTSSSKHALRRWRWLAKKRLNLWYQREREREREREKEREYAGLHSSARADGTTGCKTKANIFPALEDLTFRAGGSPEHALKLAKRTPCVRYFRNVIKAPLARAFCTRYASHIFSRRLNPANLHARAPNRAEVACAHAHVLNPCPRAREEPGLSKSADRARKTRDYSLNVPPQSGKRERGGMKKGERKGENPLTGFREPVNIKRQRLPTRLIHKETSPPSGTTN